MAEGGMEFDRDDIDKGALVKYKTMLFRFFLNLNFLV